MEFIKGIIDIMKGWGATEWSFVATILIELAVILFYNKGTMIAQSKLQSYEKEIKAKDDVIQHYQELLRIILLSALLMKLLIQCLMILRTH